MAKNISWRLSTPFRIPPEHQYFHLGHSVSDSAPRGRYWTPTLRLRGRHYEKKKTFKTSESPTTTPLQPQSLFLHAMSAHTILLLCYIHRSHVLVWPLYLVSFLSGNRSNEGAIWFRHQKQDVGHSSREQL